MLWLELTFLTAGDSEQTQFVNFDSIERIWDYPGDGPGNTIVVIGGEQLAVVQSKQAIFDAVGLEYGAKKSIRPVPHPDGWAGARGQLP